MTRRQVGAAAGVHQIMVRQWETGHRVPTVEMLGAVARALGVSPLALTDRAEVDAAELTLRDLRLISGLTQQQAASAAGMVRTTYSSLERGETASLSDPDARSLAASLGVTAHMVHAAHAVGRDGLRDARGRKVSRSDSGPRGLATTGSDVRLRTGPHAGTTRRGRAKSAVAEAPDRERSHSRELSEGNAAEATVTPYSAVE
jgi:transcriptional regulator with XRE-family HTH domain